MNVVISCEHATNWMPQRLRHQFPKRVLSSHRAWDPGAARLALALARKLRAPVFLGEVSRLAIDLNRSLHHRQLFAVPGLSGEEREALLERYYHPFRERVRASLSGRPVVHLSVHSFTPALAGERRNADIGLLYDPRRVGERALVDVLVRELSRAAPELRVRRNYPYRGVADGHTSALRRALSASRYIGVEIEINQRHVGPDFSALQRALTQAVAASLRAYKTR